jgi:hypothetical protein
MKGLVSLSMERTSLDRLLNRHAPSVSALFGRHTFLGDALTALLLSWHEQDGIEREKTLELLQYRRFLVWWHDRVRVGGRWHRRRRLRDCLDMMATPLGHFHSFATRGALHVAATVDSAARDRLCWLTAPDNLVRLLAWNQQCDALLYRRLSHVLTPLISPAQCLIGLHTLAKEIDHKLWVDYALGALHRTTRGSLCMRFHWLYWGRTYALVWYCASGANPRCPLVPDLMRCIADLLREIYLR